MSRLTLLRYNELKFMVPKEREDFWPYYGVLFADEYGILLRGIKRSDVVLDAGAHVGFFTLPAALRARMVIAVEPAPDTFRILAKNVELNGLNNVILVNKALSDYEGRGYMSGKGLSATLSQTGSVKVEVTTIDALLNSLGLDHVDVVKMDIEGSEARALKGHFLDQVRLIVVEVHGNENRRAVRAILDEKGFKVSTWRFSAMKCVTKILTRLHDFIYAELSTDFAAIRLTLRYALGLGDHPVAPVNPRSDVRLLIGLKEIHGKAWI